ncbi:MAG TPA: site-specific integrase, partial [Chloroflexota bacterium]|nr:site-specific integrase [Chloroflexota bacterium]
EKSAEALVFTNEADEPIKSLRTAWEGARDGAGLVNFHFHDLRHTFASRLVERGVPLLHVSKLLGHSTILMTQRYSHASEDALHDAVGRLDRPVGKFNVDSMPADPVVSETPVTAVH